MEPLAEATLSIGVSSALGICVNLLLIRFQQKNPTHPLFTMVKVSHIPINLAYYIL